MARSPFRALADRNFRLYFVGQTLSLVGTWMQATAMPWLVASLTADPRVIGFVGFAAQLPALLLPPVAGVVVDQVHRHRVLLLTQSLAMAQALALAALVVGGRVQLWQIVLLNLSLSAVNAFDMTARQTFLGDLFTNRDALANAIALNSAMVNAARLVGPTVAGLLIAHVGEEACFLANCLSFAAVLLALALMRDARPQTKPPRLPILRGLADGVRYVAGSPPTAAALGALAVNSLCGLPYATLMPLVVKRLLDGDPRTYGHLMTAPGVGALAAGLVIAWRGLDGVVWRIALGPVLAGGCLVAFADCRREPPALALLFAAGFGFLMLLNSVNTLLQAITPTAFRGRVLSLYTMGFMGMSPLGSLLAGWLADRFGLVGALRIGGAACACSGAVFGALLLACRGDVARMIAAHRAEQGNVP